MHQREPKSKAKAEAEHKELIVQALKDIIIKVAKEDYLLNIGDETLIFLKQTPRNMIKHLQSWGGALDFVNTKALIAKRDKEWNPSEIPTIYLNGVKKATKQLTRAGIMSDLKERTDMAFLPQKLRRI
jgi:hypothetical protein